MPLLRALPRRRLPGRRPKRPKRPRSGRARLARAGGLLLVLVVLALVLFQWKVRPVLVALADAKVSNAVAAAIDTSVLQALAETPVAYEDFIQFEKDESGNITALKSNLTGLTNVRYRLVSQVLSGLSDLSAAELSIPLGNLTGSALLSGRGPALPVRILSVGSVESRFDNSFQSTAINQTIHKIVFHVTAQVRLLVPGGVATTTVESDVDVAETVIVGAVPDSYTYFSQFDSMKEASEAYFDYGSQLEGE